MQYILKITKKTLCNGMLGDVPAKYNLVKIWIEFRNTLLVDCVLLHDEW